MIDFDKILKTVAKESESAKNGSLKIDGKTYTFTFDRPMGYYVVETEGEYPINFNTRKLSVAKKYLKDYLAN